MVWVAFPPISWPARLRPGSLLFEAGPCLGLRLEFAYASVTVHRPRHRPGCVSRARRLWPLGSAWRETDVEDTDFVTVIRRLLEGQYNSPVRVIGFNVAEGWVRDVSEDVARDLRQRCAIEGRE